MSTFEKLFKSKYSELPMWLSIVLTALVVSSSFKVLIDLPGVLDFIFQSESMIVKDIPVEEIYGDDTIITKVISKVEDRATRGMFSYYMKAYPILLGLEVIEKSMDATKYLMELSSYNSELYTDEENNEHALLMKEEVEDIKHETKEYIDILRDRYILSRLLNTTTRLISFILAITILRIPTGLGSKLANIIYTRKMRWIM